jgi:hypothetical protein
VDQRELVPDGVWLIKMFAAEHSRVKLPKIAAKQEALVHSLKSQSITIAWMR